MQEKPLIRILERVERLNEIGIALSAEQNLGRLLDRIVLGAKEITAADGGTLYLLKDDGALHFEIMRSDSLKLSLGGTSGKPIPYPPLPLYDQEGNPNLHMVAPYAAIKGCTVNIPDAYLTTDFDFKGTKAFDQRTGYRSKSFLTVPLKNHENDIIGVLQLINPIDPISREIIPFCKECERLTQSLASQAAVALSNRRLIDEQRRLFESFVKLIAAAIDEKSPYTGKHCERVPELTMMLARAAHNASEGPLAEFRMSEEDFYQLKIASWLHDCGKVTTPEWVIDKATKLETICDRIKLIELRIQILKQQARIRLLESLAEQPTLEQPVKLEEDYAAYCRQLDEELQFLRKANIGSEFMTADDQQRVKAIGACSWTNPEGELTQLLSDNEIYNLTIPKGTLTPEERQVINNHISVTIKMLESLPYPKYLRQVPEYAGAHHEHMDGSGYPRRLTRDQMSIPARIMGIADIFEALTARDRPYKKGKTLSESLFILGKMKLDRHIDPDLFDLFIRSGVYRHYAEHFMKADQIDEVNESGIPGFHPDPSP